MPLPELLPQDLAFGRQLGASLPAGHDVQTWFGSSVPVVYGDFTVGGSSGSRASPRCVGSRTGRSCKEGKLLVPLAAAPLGWPQQLAAGRASVRRLGRQAVGNGAAAGGEGESLRHLFSQLLSKTLPQVTNIFHVRRKTQHSYMEPHWVLLLNIALIVLVRAGLLRAACRALACLLSRRQQGKKEMPDASPAVVETRTGEQRTSPEDEQEEDEEAEGADSLTVSVRGDGEQTVDESEAWAKDRSSSKEESHSHGFFSAAGSILSASEVPVIICCLSSIALHLAILVVQVLHTSGHASGQIIKNLWVGQLVNYTLSSCWLLQRWLNIRLQLSRSRPSLSGDLSNLVDTAGATSRRFAQESAIAHLAKTMVWVVTGLLVLRHLGINIQRVLAVTSLSGVAFSFLLGDILNNLFGAFVLYVTQPFAQGDWVQTADGKVDGWIQNLGWYYTTVMRWEKRPHYIPNSTFGHTPIVNCSRMTHRRVLIEGPLRIRDLDKVEEILSDVRSLIENHNDVDNSMHRLCRLKKVDEFSVVIWVSCYIRTITLANFLRVQESILLGICAVLRKYETNWASSTERFRVSGEAEITSENRRVLNVRSALLRHERELEERQEELAEQKSEMTELATQLAESRRDLEPLLARLRQRQELLYTKRKSISKFQSAVRARSQALQIRSQALTKLRKAIELSQLKEQNEASKLSEEALQMREASVQKTWTAVVIERGAIESEKDAWEQEKEIIAAESLVLAGSSQASASSSESESEPGPPRKAPGGDATGQPRSRRQLKEQKDVTEEAPQQQRGEKELKPQQHEQQQVQQHTKPQHTDSQQQQEPRKQQQQDPRQEQHPDQHETGQAHLQQKSDRQDDAASQGQDDGYAPDSDGEEALQQSLELHREENANSMGGE
eukprot:TRINITY_DN12344_c0_g1_i4.p1 TRINITY_DN12344_c0_g1~~TRINITY_DN12344_c0_g1_i4.p1  ORF type:complete len:897 (-),score=218.08 TRINITY_DN12344_c0_g1_i4:58-2748(-)